MNLRRLSSTSISRMRRRASRTTRIKPMDRTILVTGASKGIGRAIAVRLARDQFRVVVHYGADRAGADETLAAVRAASGDGRIIGFDIGDRDACRAALESDMAEHGSYYGVVLNA